MSSPSTQIYIDKRIYLDAHATTWIDPAIEDRYSEYIRDLWGNASSIHFEGQKARGVLVATKKRIRDLLSIPSSYDIFFFSSATEALNTLIKGSIQSQKKKSSSPIRVVSTEVEHSAVYEVLQRESASIAVDYIPVGLEGSPSAEQVALYLQEKDIEQSSCSLGVFMAANNETGIRTQELSQIAAQFALRSIPLIVDGVASFGRVPFELHQGVSAYIFSGHKIHAPKGIAIAIVDKKMKFEPLIVGGPQESNKRAGTENIPLIALIGDQIAEVVASFDRIERKLKQIQIQFERELKAQFPQIRMNCASSSQRIPSVSNIAFPGIDGEELLILLDMMGVSASHGSACSSGALEPSRVLLKMGIPQNIATSSIRFSWSWLTSEEDIRSGIGRIVEAVRSYHQ